MPSRVIHFEIHAADPTRAQVFYEKLFDWKFAKWEGPMEYWLITTGDASTPGINGAMIKRMGSSPQIGAPVSAYVCTVNVDSVDTTVEMALASGGTVALPKMAVPGIGWLAYLIDPDGNIFGVMANDPTAQ